MSIIKHASIVGALTFLSRIAGYVREMLVAAILGAGPLTDAYMIAFKTPNLFRRMFAEGAFNSAFVPIFTKELAGNGKERAIGFAENAFAFMTVTLLVFTILIEIIMPWFMYVMAAGFHEKPEVFNLAVDLTRISFPYLLFISLVALLTGVLNSLHRFVAGAFAPVLLNLCMIAALLWLPRFTATPAHALVIGVFVAGIVQLGYLYICIRRADFKIRWRKPSLTPEMKTLLKRMVPGIIGAGVGQINIWVDTFFASWMTGAISYLSFADRLYQFPLAIIGTAVGTALLPMLSLAIRNQDNQTSQEIQNRSLELALLLTIPAAVALLFISDWITAGIYERGAFTSYDTLNTAHALAAFAAGLPAMVMVKVFAPGFFARDDTTTPIKIAFVCIAMNVVLILLTIHTLAHVGIALATSCSAWLNAIFLGYILRKRQFLIFDQQLKSRTIRIIAASLVMVGAIVGTEFMVGTISTTHPIRKEIVMLLVCATGGGAFAIAAVLFRAVDINEFRSAFKRKSKPTS